ncbi:putative monosaccharide transporter [Meira miltonrushii]|uniref:Putative monosaccharide transporter n=1 Tax=Meira miltonrushii TaxID=1280837 RepID=A0A316VCZ5_9BASI|nr:putative monosaccharide transporter [Meira miltonrushii]PWN34103.1 putative monosaccharide transporter [Meira miltonrushii]
MQVHSHAQITLPAMLLGVGICVGGFLFGYDLGVISGCLIMEPFIRVMGVYDPTAMLADSEGYLLSANRQSLITALLSAGTFFGALAQAPISDFMGRRKSMLVWAITFSIGAIIQTTSGESANTAANVGQIVAGRTIAGLGVGALSGLAPLYLAETAPKAIRGAMVSCYQLFIIAGICVSYCILYGTYTIKTSSACWRIPVALQLLWGLVLIVIMLALPESPRWLLQKERAPEARKVMARMRGLPLEGGDAAPAARQLMEEDVEEMLEGIREEARTFEGYNYLTGYKLCFSTEQQMWRRTLTGCMLQLLQQLCGQNFYYLYGPTLFTQANVPLEPLLIQLIFGVVSLICTVPALLMIEKVGRRKSLVWGAILQAICAFTVAFVGHYGLPHGKNAKATTPSQKSSANAFIAFAVLHLAFYSMFWGPTPWIFCSENFPQHLRAKAISLCSATNWIWNFLLSFFSNKISDKYGTFIMLIFGSVLVFAAIFSYLVVPELKGLSLEQVNEMYEDKKLKPWNSGKWQPQTGRDTNRSAIGLSHILKLGTKKQSQVL